MPVHLHFACPLAAVLVIGACDGGEPPALATTAVSSEPAMATPEDPPSRPPSVSPFAQQPLPTRSDAPPPETATPATPTPAHDPSFDAVIERLAERLPREPQAGKLGFAQLKAAKLDDAQTYFAQASKLDVIAWKHPFNLACAAALAKDDALARVALAEAVRRGGDAAVDKARRDRDLERLRTQAWFEPVLRGEPPPAATPPGVPAAPAVVPSTPPEPIPPPMPETPPEPAIAMTPLPRGTAKKIAKPDLAPIIATLTTTHQAKPVIHGSLEYVDSGGTTMRWVVYEFSLFDACLATQPDRKAGKRICREKLAVAPGAGQCNAQGIALVTSLAPAALAHDEKLDVSCKLRKVNRLEVADYDGDGHDEILVDVRGRYSRPEYRTAEETDYVRAVRILRPDGSTQLAFDIAWSNAGEHPLSETARKLGVRAGADDGMHDLVIASRSFTGTDVELDGELWPSDYTEELGPIRTEVWKYDPKADVWLDPKP